MSDYTTISIYTNSNNYKFQTFFKNPSFDSSPIIFVAHHGAGSTHATFDNLSLKLSHNAQSLNYSSTPGFFSFDIRGHGMTNLLNDNNNTSNYNLSIDQLIDDFKFILSHFLKSLPYNPIIILLGHSLGGSVLTKFLYNNQSLNNIHGLIIIDTVEEIAINSLNLMNNYILKLPKSFNSKIDAINYFTSSNLINNKSSALLSIPSLLKKDSLSNNYKFITDLSLTKPFWFNWFINSSEFFIKISNKFPKLLILANNDNYLDKFLIIGQMNGSYQLKIFNNLIESSKIGHFIHEDIPNNLSITLLDFIERNNYKNFHKLNKNNEIENNENDLIMKLNKKWNVQQ